MAKKGGWCDKHKYAYSRNGCPNCAEGRIAAERAEEKRKFPHSDIEAAYQHVSVYWIMIGGDKTPFVQSLFFAGYDAKGPKFVAPVDGVLNNVPTYTSREAAHIAVTDMIRWCKEEHVPVPEGLTIGH